MVRVLVRYFLVFMCGLCCCEGGAHALGLPFEGERAAQGAAKCLSGKGGTSHAAFALRDAVCVTDPVCLVCVPCSPGIPKHHTRSPAL